MARKKQQTPAAPEPIKRDPTPDPVKSYTMVNDNPNPPEPMGMDPRVAAQERSLGTGSSLHRRILGEHAFHSYMFGRRAVGVGDSGVATGGGGPLPGGAIVRRNGEVVKFSGAPARTDYGLVSDLSGNQGQAGPRVTHVPGSEPSFAGAEPNEIRLAQEMVNRQREIESMMRDSGAPGKGAGGNTKMNDVGMRDDTPTSLQNAPVRSWIDESIKLKKD